MIIQNKQDSFITTTSAPHYIMLNWKQTLVNVVLINGPLLASHFPSSICTTPDL